MEFKEYLVKRKKSTKEIILSVVFYLLAALLSFFSFGFIAIPMIGSLVMLVIMGLFFAAYKLSARFNREYEYIITGDGIDVDVIYNKTSRKRLASFSVKDVTVIASVDDENQKHYLNGVFEKEVQATTNSKDADVYFAIVEKEGRLLVKFEPPYGALEIMKKHAPSKVFIKK